ncbi:hypothetical protein BJ875DRAFT_70521 [Amylocarpus encephaloides]|uniref:Uncharacterized protein n=1 Tax=Amylocarpus encephaloides TaxID=45428 RepID=A0A9P7YQZ5_9HELO|nr:hypothetical protein BJ875DRAFT_70521 [Amylocarpus encephaloides]
MSSTCASFSTFCTAVPSAHPTTTCTNASTLALIPPPLVTHRTCVVSSNFSISSLSPLSILAANSSNPHSGIASPSIFQICCGEDTAVGNYTAESKDGGSCGFAYCNVTDGKAAEGFMACLNATADGVRSMCFVGPGEGADASEGGSSTKMSAGETKAEKMGMVGMGLFLGIAVGVVGLGGI